MNTRQGKAKTKNTHLIRLIRHRILQRALPRHVVLQGNIPIRAERLGKHGDVPKHGFDGLSKILMGRGRVNEVAVDGYSV